MTTSHITHINHPLPVRPLGGPTVDPGFEGPLPGPKTRSPFAESVFEGQLPIVVRGDATALVEALRGNLARHTERNRPLPFPVDL